MLDWFAQQADLSLVIPETIPPGTFNYSDTKDYTPAEAIDLLNSVLLTKNYYLVRHDRMLMLVNLDDGIPKNLVTTVPVESLDSKGESELVNVQFALNKIRPEDVEAEVRKLLGPQGSVESLAKSQQLSVTDTAGRLRAVRNYLKNTPEGTLLSGLKIFQLKYAQPEEVLPIVRQLLEIPEDKNLAVDGSIRIAQESGTDRLLVSGRPDKVARATEIIAGLDKPPTGGEASRLSGTPQLEIYSLNGADGTSALAVLQTVLAGQLDVHLSVDPKAGTLVALARPAQHATIKAVLKQLLGGEGQQKVEVIRLTRLDPQSAIDAINRFFTSGDPKQASSTAPQILADSANHQLIIRATETQIVQIRDLLIKMGEPPVSSDPASRGGHIRTLPMSEGAAQAALQRVQDVWPTMRPNQIRIIGPRGRKRFQRGAGRRGRIAQSAPRVETFDPTEENPLLLDLRPADPPRSPEERLPEAPRAEPVPQGDHGPARACGQALRRPHPLRGRSGSREGSGGQIACSDRRDPQSEWFDDFFRRPGCPRRVRAPAVGRGRWSGQWTDGGFLPQVRQGPDRGNRARDAARRRIDRCGGFFCIDDSQGPGHRFGEDHA